MGELSAWFPTCPRRSRTDAQPTASAGWTRCTSPSFIADPSDGSLHDRFSEPQTMSLT
jgi:hypothetical protein